MQITRKSPLTGKNTTLAIPVTEDQLLRWQNGELIQIAMPQLTPDQREFIKTGITPAESANFFFSAIHGEAPYTRQTTPDDIETVDEDQYDPGDDEDDNNDPW